MKKILLYGDSNTYGYDPRGMLGMRYPHEVIWPSIVRNRLADRYEIIEEGENGRRLPDIPRDEGLLRNRTCMLGGGDIMAVMLGTNDILFSARPRPEEAVSRMRLFLEWAADSIPDVDVIVIGPVGIGNHTGDMQKYHDAGIVMDAGFASVCADMGVTYWNAADWGIHIAFDGVHFSEKGHRTFAERFITSLESCYGSD